MQIDADIVTGTRYISKKLNLNTYICDCCNDENKTINNYVIGGTIWTFKRKFISRIANTLASLITDKETDYTGSFRLYKKSAFMEIIENCKSNNFSFQMEAMTL